MKHLRYALRQFRRSPGFAAAAVLTLALGIGANTAIFSVLEGVVLSPLPYHDPDRLVLLLLYNHNLKYATYLSYPDFIDWERNARSFERTAAFSRRGFDLTHPGTPQHVSSRDVTSGFFSTLGVKPAMGRDFSAVDDQHGSTPSVMLSYRLWMERYAGNPGALGQSVTLSGVDYTIIGVTPAQFHFDDYDADVFTTFATRDQTLLANRTIHDIGAIGRLRPGVTIGQAHAEMNTIQAEIGRLNPETERGLGTYIEPLKKMVVGEAGGTIVLLLGAVGLVLLIACANVANLLLARSAARAREFAIRLAVGAGRSHILRQSIIESLLLAVTGGLLGLAFAKWGLGVVLGLMPGSLPRVENVGLDMTVLLFALAVSAAAGIAFGVLAAGTHLRRDLETSLKEGARGSGSHQRTQRALVVVQVALALVLLTGASLLLRTIRNLWDVDPGFDPSHVLTFKVGLSPTANQSAPATRAAYRQLMERIRRIPGVQAADLTALLPLSEQDNSGGFWPGPQASSSVAEAPRAIYYWTGPNYLDAMGIPLLQGRYLSAADTAETDPVVAIDSRLARIYFPHTKPVGQIITVANWGPVRIVGVVGRVKHYGLDNTNDQYSKNEIYASIYQLADKWLPAFRGDISVAVRTPLDAAAILPSIKTAVFEAGGAQPVYNIESMRELVSRSMSTQRFPMVLLVAFAALALLLASIGIYGVISYAMARRVREIAIRMALGAEKGVVLRMVIAQGIKLAAAGVAIGIAASLILARALSSFSHLLYGVRPEDPLTLTAVSLLLIATAIAACYVPAHRATKIDPMIALRCDG